MSGINSNPNSYIGLYNVPNVYLNEVNLSASPTVVNTETTTSLVIGVSKKGPINYPVYIQSQDQFTSIFGNIDRHLQYKQSFFHRTALNMLQNGPIYAMNLYLTDPTVDLLDFKNISCATNYSNSLNKSIPYDDVFIKNDFWILDSPTFEFNADAITNNTTDLLSVTNISNQAITVFLFKSSITGYDVTALSYYGSLDNLPSFVNPLSLISDYLVKVFVIQGDFTNYQVLANDPIWGNYFTTNGLIPSMVNKLLYNEPNAKILGNYDVSLIPYFRGTNNNDMYIETVINADTSKTGLFVGYRDTLLQGNPDQGLIDMVGNWIAADALNPESELTSVNFLSYNENLSEQIKFSDVYLDTPGNVWGWQTAVDPTTPSRHTSNSNLLTVGLYFDATFSNTTGVYTPSFDAGAYAIYNNSYLSINTSNTTVTIAPISSTIAKNTYRTDLVVLNSTGNIQIFQGGELTTTDFSTVAIDPSIDQYIGAPRLLTSDILLGAVRIQRGVITGSGFPTADTVNYFQYFPVGLDNNGWLKPDVTITNPSGNNVLNLTFGYTLGQLTAINLRGNRNTKYFNDYITKINAANSVVLDHLSNKIYLSSCTVTVNSNLTSYNSISIVAPSGINILNPADNTIIGSTNNYTANNVTFYAVDNEFLLGTASMTTKAGYVSTVTNPYTYATDGVIGTASLFYKDYINGMISTSNLAYGQVFDGTINFTVVGSANYIDIPYFTDTYSVVNPGDVLYVAGLSTQSNSLNIQYTVITTGATTVLGIPTYRIQVVQTVIPQTDITAIVWHVTDGRYLKCYTLNGILKVDFTPSDLSTIYPIEIPNLSSILVTSDRADYQSTVEIETLITNNQIAVDSTRYAGVLVGDFLQALVDPSTLDLANGEVGRYLTRIVSKTTNPSDATQFILVTDSPIYIINASDVSTQVSLQTYHYKPFSSFVTGYKGTKLNGFKISSAAMPDGTEARQAQILSMIGLGTPLCNALANPDKIQWRYLVDSFGLGLQAQSKQVYVDLCGQKTDCLAFINTPSAKQFKASTSPTFVNPDGTLNYQWVSIGGNPSANNAYTYSLGTGVGQSSVSYWHPWFYVTDNNAPLLVPPASYVASTYMHKFTSNNGNVYSFTIAAGITNGVVSGINDVEITLETSDISYLINTGINTVSYKMDRDFIINTEMTASVIPYSSLSLIHCRELLIDLETDLYDMLLGYQWQFNTPAIEAEIKDAADQICQKYLDRGGLYNFENIMDSTNNTNQIIDAQIGVLTTEVEITKGMGIIINQVNILPTGTLSSSGFN